MGTAEAHKGYDLVRLKGSLEQAGANVDAALRAVVESNQLAQRSRDARLEDELLSVITALR